jgi:hypothetical protein
MPGLTMGRKAIAGEHPLGLKEVPVETATGRPARKIMTPRARASTPVSREVVKKIPKLLSRRGAAQAGRELASSMATGAAFAGGLPIVHQVTQREAEKKKLEEYLGKRRGGKLRSKIRSALRRSEKS